MSKINNVELYHKDIDKKYSRLYIKMTIDNADFIEADISQLLKNYFEENKQPFEVSKTYEVCIYPEYISDDDPAKLNEVLFDKAESLRAALESIGINIDLVYVFGNCVPENPKVILEIEERTEKREKNTFVMANEEIYNMLLNYCQKLLLNIYLEDENLTPKERKKLNRFIKNNHADLPSLSEEEADKYYWAMQIQEGKKNLVIINKKENGFLSFTLEGKIWVQSVFSKIHNQEHVDQFNKQILGDLSETLNKLFNSIYNVVNSYYVMCEIFDIPATNDRKIVWKEFFNKYWTIGYIVLDEEAKELAIELKERTGEIFDKYIYISESGNECLLNKINNNEITVCEAYSILQEEK